MAFYWLSDGFLRLSYCETRRLFNFHMFPYARRSVGSTLCGLPPYYARPIGPRTTSQQAKPPCPRRASSRLFSFNQFTIRRSLMGKSDLVSISSGAVANKRLRRTHHMFLMALRSRECLGYLATTEQPPLRKALRLRSSSWCLL